MMKPLIAFLLALPLAAQTGILIEHQVRGPVLAAPALYACMPPGTTPGPCVFQPVARIEGAVLGADLVLRILAPPPVVVNIEPPPLVFAVRQPDGSWIATNPRLIAGATVEVKRNGLENYSAGPAPDFTITIAAGRATITPKQPWGADNTIAVRIW